VSHVELTILGEIQPGHTYALGLPPDTDVYGVIEPLRQLQAVSGTQTIVFAPGTSLADASSQALADAQAKVDHLLSERTRLRGLLDEALIRWWQIGSADPRDNQRIREIRREEGLT